MDRYRGDRPIDLYPIFPLMREPRVQQPVVKCGVVGKNEQPFAVEIQPSHGIYITRDGKEILERSLSFLRGKLREDLEGFVYNVVLVHVFAVCI